MLPDKVIKKKYKPIFWKNPEKYYATQVLLEEGFARSICQSCNKPFWSTTERLVCGDAVCSGEGFAFIGNSPAQNTLSYIQVWQRFRKIFTEAGYTAVDRYPIVARWNPTMEYTNASIAAFQPYVISGEVQPPANPLIIPQLCLRFGDTDNVGITMSHNLLFCMIGQHVFVQPKDWDQNKVFRHMLNWNIKGLGLEKKDMTFHEDAWAGGGNVGPCMEMFSKGLELWNQVYMLYEQTPSGVKDLKLKVLDMGLGMERQAWFSQGSASQYDATFPAVMNKLRKVSGIQTDEKFLQRYTPHGSLLNNDEVEDMDKAWQTVAKNLSMDVKELKQEILPLSQLYSVGEHARAILVVLNDGGLPSNTGGGHNLRMLIRRSFNFIKKNEWNIDLAELCRWHTEHLKKIAPELSENLEEIEKILAVEKRKWRATQEKTKKIVAKLDKTSLNEKKLLELYDSYGISPDMIEGVETPDDFYGKVAEKHENKVHIAATKKADTIDLGKLSETKALYFEDYKVTEFKATVIKIKDDIVVLDKTAFYPTSGGQMHDLGTMNSKEVIEVWKQGNLILHKVKNINFREGDKINCHIDKKRRIQMAQHHTATHIINAAARIVLGKHINQAGAFKDVDKARIDITHYDSISEQELKAIESEANNIIQKHIPIEKRFYPRGEAEKLFGMQIYQGGVPISKMLRIVNIKNTDVECCGGTHLDNTKEAQTIKILKSSKVQDGIIRLTFVAGPAAKLQSATQDETLLTLQGLLGCDNTKQIPARAQELFTVWKRIVKKKKEAKKVLVSIEEFQGNILQETARILKTQPEHLVKTVKRFLKDLEM